MKKFNDFMQNAHFGKVMLAVFIFVLAISYSMFLTTNMKLEGGFAYFPMAFSVIMSAWASGILWFSRKSDEFYDKIKVLKQRIEETETRKEIEGLLRNDYENLRKEASHYDHTIALKEIASIAKVKLKYVK